MSKNLSIYLNAQQHKELKILCAELEISLSQFAKNAIEAKVHQELEKARNK